jgi:hypothetical protein
LFATFWENVPLMGNVSECLHANAQLVMCGFLGTPMVANVNTFGSYVHYLWWKWTNTASALGLFATLQKLVRL